ncbi:MAG TPA: phospholipase A [Gammaproteobacteria bacterium]
MTFTNFLPAICALSLLFATAASAADDEDAETDAAADQEHPLRLPSRIDEDPTRDFALTSNEPIYFVVGGNDDSTGKFQFSFQYRIFDGDSGFVDEWPWLDAMHFAYTQTSVWDLLGDSSPFKDTTYRPSLFWQKIGRSDTYAPDFLRLGYEHESNGEDLEDSRSIDSLFFFPGWLFDVNERQLLVGAKFRLPLTTSEYNEDITDYRGYVDLYARYGREDSWVSTAALRYGEARQGSLELTFSYPLRTPIFARTGGYFYVEIFHGHGETLIDYNRHAGTQVRVGLAIVR